MKTLRRRMGLVCALVIGGSAAASLASGISPSIEMGLDDSHQPVRTSAKHRADRNPIGRMSVINDARSGDVRIEPSWSDAEDVTLDFDAGTGNLFAVVNWYDHWTVYLSANNGASWTQSYDWFTGNSLVDVDAVVADGYLYVGYVDAGDRITGRVRRFGVADGVVDGVYGWKTALDAESDILEIDLASPVDEWDARVYFCALLADHSINWMWATMPDAANFNDESPMVLNAASGLDHTWNYEGRDLSGRGLFISYIGVDGAVHVLQHEPIGVEPIWTDIVVDEYTGVSGSTAIAAFKDTVICAYEYDEHWGTGIRYAISYGGGEAWNFGHITDTETDTGEFRIVDVCARLGGGLSAAYCREGAGEDEVMLRTRAGYAPGPWEAPVRVNEHDSNVHALVLNLAPHSNGSTLEYIGTLKWWDGAEYVTAIGEASTSTYGETITVQSPQVMSGFTMYFTDNDVSAPLIFDAFIGTWDVMNSHVDSMLYLDGPYATTHNGGAGGMEAITVDVGEIILDPAETYIIGVCTSNWYDGVMDYGTAGFLASDNYYPGGDFFFLNNGDEFNAVFTDTFSTYGPGDLAFNLDARPMWSYGMIYLDNGVPWYVHQEEGQTDPCPWDTAPTGSGDGTVGLGDLNSLLSNWGACAAPCPWDFAPVGGDGTVGLGDLNALLSNWGPCP